MAAENHEVGRLALLDRLGPFKPGHLGDEGGGPRREKLETPGAFS